MRISDWSSDVCSSDLAIVPVKDRIGEVVLDHDEHMRPGTTLESLAKLKPAFEGFGKGGFEAVAKERYPEIEELRYVHHGGNSSGVVAGAGLVLVGSKQFGEKAGLKPRARSDEHMSELQSLMRISYDVFCLKKKK